ncbi:MAG TPA: NAD-dependent epimerase/dehydratase family protein [Burkholderiales bacterium]|jgi:nucleoside-diphosphate-sugar epimerase|nr:NAD-dependent epimerase/dehydratase family protein [Burkholderiales bacterium]
MIVAITGGTGFIGAKLVAAHLSRGDIVRVLTRRQNMEAPAGVQKFVGDLANPSFDPSAFVEGADVVYNCAGELRDPGRMRGVHVEGAQRLLAAFNGHGRWVQLSSVGAYGPQRAGVVTEDTELRPQGEYEVTKTEADALVENAGRRGLDCVILRPSNVFGAGMPNQSLYQMARMVSRGLFFYVGAPGALANYIHVDNVIHALMLCATHKDASGRTYILSDECNLEAFIGAMAGILQRRRPFLRLPESIVRAMARAGKILPAFPLTASRIDALTNRAKYSTERIARELGYRHRLSIEEGLIEMLSVKGSDSEGLH